MSVRVLTMVVSLALSSVMAGCNAKHCAILPCPAPGFDVETCRCQPSSFAGAPSAGAGMGVSSAGVGGSAAGASGASPTAGASGDPISFPCGATTCDGRSQICEHVVGGAPPGVDNYDCDAIPTACLKDDSCACAISALRGRGANSCSSDAGFPTVRIDVP
jgi:hypothetical protein